MLFKRRKKEEQNPFNDILAAIYKEQEEILEIVQEHQKAISDLKASANELQRLASQNVEES